MKKYYIKPIFGEWLEVTKEKYEQYKKSMFEGCVTGEHGRRYIEENYLREVNV